MSTITFITWPLEYDAAFRPAYAALVGESVQRTPNINIEESAYILGSQRVTPAQCEALIDAIGPAINYGDDMAALGWVNKPDPE